MSYATIDPDDARKALNRARRNRYRIDQKYRERCQQQAREGMRKFRAKRSRINRNPNPDPGPGMN